MDIGEDRKMTPTETGFEWEGDLIRGMFRFAPWWAWTTWPAYLRNGNATDYWTTQTNFVTGVDQNNPYIGFYILEAGKYRVEVNFETGRVDLECLEKHPDKTVYNEELYILLNTDWFNEGGVAAVGKPMTKEDGNGHFSCEGEIQKEPVIDGGAFAIFASFEGFPRYAKSPPTTLKWKVVLVIMSRTL